MLAFFDGAENRSEDTNQLVPGRLPFFREVPCPVTANILDYKILFPPDFVADLGMCLHAVAMSLARICRIRLSSAVTTVWSYNLAIRHDIGLVDANLCAAYTLEPTQPSGILSPM